MRWRATRLSTAQVAWPSGLRERYDWVVLRCLYASENRGKIKRGKIRRKMSSVGRASGNFGVGRPKFQPGTFVPGSRFANRASFDANRAMCPVCPVLEWPLHNTQSVGQRTEHTDTRTQVSSHSWICGWTWTPDCTGVNDSSNSWRLIRRVIIFTESVIPPQAQTTSRMRSISVNGLVTFHLGERSGTFPELPYDHFLFGITAYAYVCTWGWGVVIETTHTMGTWHQGAFDCFLSWTELLAIDKGLMA